MYTPKQLENFCSENPRTLANTLFKGWHPLGTPWLDESLNGGVAGKKAE
jgi:hypothetical protein